MLVLGGVPGVTEPLPLPDATIPALVEFSLYAGIHKIDGRSTGLLPEGELPLLAIGIATRHGRQADL